MNCIVICHLFVKLKKKYPKNIVLHVAKPLYNLTEIENHWFAIYLDYYREKLRIKMLSYDKYLFIIKNDHKNFGIIQI